MKNYQSEAKNFSFSTFLQQKQLFTVLKHISEGTVSLSHFGETSSKLHTHGPALTSEGKAYYTFFFCKSAALIREATVR